MVNDCLAAQIRCTQLTTSMSLRGGPLWADVAISCDELRYAAGRGDSHGPTGLGMTRFMKLAAPIFTAINNHLSFYFIVDNPIFRYEGFRISIKCNDYGFINRPCEIDPDVCSIKIC